MPRSNCQWKFSLLLAVIISLIAGCSGKDKLSPADAEAQAFENLRSEIREAIDDPAREGKAIALVDSLADDLDSLREVIAARKKRVRQLNADYESTRADFNAFLEQIKSEIRSNKRQVWERYSALLSVTTPEEQSALLKVHSRAINVAFRHIQSI